MRHVSIREANRSLSRLLEEVERGETVVITREGKPVAQLAPSPANRRDDPEVRAARERWCAHLDRWKGDGYRVGRITEDDKYGNADT